MRYFSITLLIFHQLLAHAQSVDALPPGVQRLLEAYPEQLKGYQDNYILWNDGSKMLYNDGRFKTEEAAFDSTDLEDQMNAIVYPPGLPVDTPGYNCDPGTLRCQEFFMQMYGNTEAAAKSHLVPVIWLGPKQGHTKRIWATSINGVNEHLQAVAQELVAHPDLRS